MTTILRHSFRALRLGAFPVLAAALFATDAETDPVRALREQNQKLQQQVDEQQRQINELRERLDGLQQPAAAPAPAPIAEAPPETLSSRFPAFAETDRQIRLSGEAGLAFFSSRFNGQFPNAEFRADDAKLFVEAQVWRNAYFFGGIDLVTREASDEYFHVGELYADFERVFVAGRDRTFNVRAGRFYLPFGEEYQVRNVVDNPLITHSVADIWGIDEGVQAYGQWGPVRYNLAVQNGGHKTLHDYDSDKSVVARVSVDPVPQLHLSASAMRTGRLNNANDVFSEVWLAGAFFRALGPVSTTPTFHAELAEVDAAWHWPTGHFKGAAGWIGFDDDNPAGGDKRNMSYFSLETVQQMGGGFFGAARYSGLHAPKGFPLVGLGNFSQYEFVDPPTKDLERLSLGVGYRFAAPLVWKFDYSWEYGRLMNGASRSGEDNMLSTEIAMRF